MAWIFLLLAGLFEIVWAYTMKISDGFTRPLPALVTILALIASLGCMSVAMRAIPLGVAYTIWTGIGAVGGFALGVFAFGEQAGVMRIAAACLIVSGLVLMKLSDMPE